MKKMIAVIISAILVIGTVVLAACSKNTDNNTTNTAVAETKEVKIVTTIFPIYDWVTNITEGADNVKLTMLLDKGVDLHSYQPTADDMVKISDADMFIYVGGESDAWVEDALKNKSNENMVAINLLEALGDNVKEEEIKEGMEAEEHDHEREEGEEHEEGEEEGPAYDEHVWLSLRNAQILVNHIALNLEKIDTQNKDAYAKNTEAYTEKLNALDQEYMAAIDAMKNRTLLFGDRFPFRYLTEDYGLDYYAAFVGCSAETEASFETISFLAQKADELGLKSVVTIEGTDHKIAQTIIENTKEKNQTIVTMDSMQSKTAADVKAGVTYLGVMQDNLAALKDALK